MRAAVQRLNEVASRPEELPDAQASERVEHVDGVALPGSITLDKIPSIQLDARIDPRRMMTQPSVRAVQGGSLGENPAAEEAVVGRTVGGNTGRFKDGVDHAPPSEPFASHEVPAVFASPPKRWWPAVAIAGCGLAAVVIWLGIRAGSADVEATAAEGVASTTQPLAAPSPAAQAHAAQDGAPPPSAPSASTATSSATGATAAANAQPSTPAPRSTAGSANAGNPPYEPSAPSAPSPAPPTGPHPSRPLAAPGINY
jgi:hypothetical protein